MERNGKIMHKFKDKTKILPITSNFDGFRFSVSCNNKNDINWKRDVSGRMSSVLVQNNNIHLQLYLLSYGIVDATASSSSAVNHFANVEEAIAVWIRGKRGLRPRFPVMWVLTHVQTLPIHLTTKSMQVDERSNREICSHVKKLLK